MIKKVVPILISSLVGFTGTNSFNHTPNYSDIHNFINYEYPAFRLGDYEIEVEEFVTSAGGQIKFFRIQAIIPQGVLDILDASNNIYFAIANYRYNPDVNLTMYIDFFVDDEFLDHAILDMEQIPLSATMLKKLPYTEADIPYEYNPFNTDNWDVGATIPEVRVTFIIPYTAYSNPPGDWLNALRNLTIFTEINSGTAGAYDYGYSVGYSDGDIDGYNKGFSEGMQSTEDGGVWNTIFMAVLAPFSLLKIEIFPGVTLGMIALIPIVFGLIAFIFKLGGKGSG